MPNKQNHKGRSKYEGPFVKIPHLLTDTAAWRSLSPQARVVLIELIRIYNGRNNGYLALSARDAAARCNIAKDTATKVFRELIEKGFVELVVPGGFSMKLRHAAEYRLTHLRCDRTGEVGRYGFKRWKSPELA